MAIYDLQEKAIVLRAEDDVAVLRERVPAGAVLKYDGRKIRLHQTIQPGHKVALREIPCHGPIRKYGQIVGFASQNILAGEHVHVHNVEAKSFARDCAYATEAKPTVFYPEREMRTFLGFQRPDGRAGTRNYLAVISTSNCSATATRHIADRFRSDGLRGFPNVDGVFAICHHSGCGMPLGGDDHRRVQRILAGFAEHPNVAGYLFVGLGCEMNQAKRLIEDQGLARFNPSNSPLPPIITIQEVGGTQKAVETGAKRIAEMLPHVNEVRRTLQPVSSICLATQCGGSDANSGITSNPAVGFAADQLVRYGATVILGETAEIYGAEHMLTRRAKNERVGKKLIERIRWWEDYTSLFGAKINHNLSPGNRGGGLTTIYEKSLGAVAKGGTTPLNAVYLYGERVREKGLVMMDTPSYDPPSVTGMVAGGANMIVFTTGRGSVFGLKPVPSIKVASNSPLYEHMLDDMDINAGVILEGESVEAVGQQILEEIIAVASGKKTKSELQGVGEEEFIPWVLGPMQ